MREPPAQRCGCGNLHEGFRDSRDWSKGDWHSRTDGAAPCRGSHTCLAEGLTLVGVKCCPGQTRSTLSLLQLCPLLLARVSAQRWHSEGEALVGKHSGRKGQKYLREMYGTHDILILSQGVTSRLWGLSVHLCVRDMHGLPLPFAFALLLPVQLLGHGSSEPSEGGSLPVFLPGRGPFPQSLNCSGQSLSACLPVGASFFFNSPPYLPLPP